MEKIKPDSKFNLKPTAKQARAITKLCVQLGISEPLENSPANRWEARNLIFKLREKRRQK